MERYERDDRGAYLLAQWWAEITVDGSRDHLFVPPASLGKALAYFESSDVNLIFELDKRGIWFAMWFTPLFSGLSATLWVRKDYRGSHAMLRAVERGYDIGLAAVPVLVGVTRQELLRVHRRLGYNIVGSVPHLIGDKAMWIVALTREGWQARKARHIQRQEAVIG